MIYLLLASLLVLAITLLLVSRREIPRPPLPGADERLIAAVRYLTRRRAYTGETKRLVDRDKRRER